MDHPRRAHQRLAVRRPAIPVRPVPQNRPLYDTDDRTNSPDTDSSDSYKAFESESDFEPDECNNPVDSDRDDQPKFALADSSTGERDSSTGERHSSTSEQDFYRQKIQQYSSAGPTVANHSERTAKLVQAEEKKWIQYVPNAHAQLARTDTRQGSQRTLRVLTLVKHYATRTRPYSKHTFFGGSGVRAHALAKPAQSRATGTTFAWSMLRRLLGG